MKKFLGILVVVAMCICMVVPAAFAANNASQIANYLEGVDIGGLSDSELSAIISDLEGKLGLSSTDIKKAIMNLDGDVAATPGAAQTPATPEASAGDTGSILDSLSGILGGMDVSWVTDIVSDPSAILGMFSGGSGDAGAGFDLSALTDMIGGAFGDSGIDLSSITSGLGDFDISGLLGGLGDLGGGLGGGDSTGTTEGSGASGAASGATDMISGIVDKLMGGLEGLGLDSSMIEGLLDNDIVNFFANLYLGLGKTEDAPATTAAPTTKPPVVTTKTPKTGDTSAVFVALGTISVAAAAAFVCLKKKEN